MSSTQALVWNVRSLLRMERKMTNGQHHEEEYRSCNEGRRTAPFETDQGARLSRDRGTPQGGVISPILMNLFMHYAFDAWMQRHFPQCPFARYADDAVIHCRSQEQAQEMMHAIASRLEQCGLTMHPEKSKIVYCKDKSRTQTYPNVTFTFLGFLFRPRRAMTKHGQVSTSFLPGVSPAALKQEWLRKIRKAHPRQFAHWQFQGMKVG